MSDDSALLRLASLVDSSDDAIISTQLDGTVASWNAGAEKIFGYSAQEMIGSPITTLFPPERLAEETEFLERIRLGERIEHFEAVRRTKTGELIDVSVTLSPILDRAGAIVGISTIARDISDQKRAERAARADRTLLNVTLSSIGDAVVTTDTAGRVTFMNAVAEALSGWTVKDALGQPLGSVLVLVNEFTRQPADNPVARVLRDGHLVGLANHTILIGRDGRAHPIDDSAAPIHDERGEVFGVVMVFRDVSLRRRHEQDLLRLAAIVESSEDAIITQTLAGIVTTWNPGAERVFGYTAQEMLGRPITTLFPPERLTEEAEFLRRLAAGERIQPFETERIRKDGERIHISVTLSPLKNAAGEMIGASKVARDITERTNLVRREHAARQEAEEANRLKDQFLATLSHELRTPLNAIYGWTRMLRTGTLDGSAMSHALEVIDRNCKAQIDLITDLLDISRISTGRLTIEPRPVDLRVPLQAAIDAISPAALAKGVALDVSIDAEAPVVGGDSDRLQQVFLNLLTNAVKFTGRHGQVRVALRHAGPNLEVTFTDTGVGIDPEVLPYIFERFRQGDSSSSRPYGGLGLGLALTRHLVELHDGNVEVTSQGEGGGSCFTVRLPVLVAATGPERAAQALAPPGTTFPRLEGLRVLFVDDETDARDLVKDVLERCGAVVTTADSAPSALLLLREDRPDVLISDIGMPGLDGYELIRRVRNMEHSAGSPATPAIALTAYAGAEDRKRALESGFQSHIGKPVDPLQVAAAVLRLIRTD